MPYQEPVKTWPASYKATIVDVHESERHDIWINSADVRKVLPTLRADARLAKEHGVHFRKLDNTKRLFFSESALKKEMQYLRSQSAMMFQAWLDKTVYYQAARKRGEAHVLAPMPGKVTGQPDTTGTTADDDLHVPKRRLEPPARPVRPPPTLFSKKPGVVRRSTVNPLLAMWRGQYELWYTTLAGGFAALGWIGLNFLILNLATDPQTYDGSYAVRQWVVLFCAMAIPFGIAFWAVSVMRSSVRSSVEGRSMLVGFVMVVCAGSALGTSLELGRGVVKEWLQGWWGTVTFKIYTSEVIHDPVLGRIVVRGDTGWGSYKALEAALQKKPALSVVEVQGPGGYAIEGMAMGRLIKDRRLDTVAFGSCASACTLVFAAGNERYLGPNAKMGFHRSGNSKFQPSQSWTEFDHQIAEYYRAQGANSDFVKRALDTPFDQLWVAEHGEMFAAGYATRRWDER